LVPMPQPPGVAQVGSVPAMVVQRIAGPPSSRSQRRGSAVVDVLGGLGAFRYGPGRIVTGPTLTGSGVPSPPGGRAGAPRPSARDGR
jgi:hypothetical protein